MGAAGTPALRQERGDWFNALEFTIEAREGGTTLMRYLHSGIFVDDWDTQYDGVSQHTDFYLHTLGEYLRHFAGRPATYIGGGPMGIQAPADTARPDGFERMQRALGFGDAVSEGDVVRLTPAGLQPVDGVDHLPAAELHRGAQRRRAVLLLRAQRLRPTGCHEHPLVRRRGRRRARRARLAGGAGRCAELTAPVRLAGATLGEHPQRLGDPALACVLALGVCHPAGELLAV